MKNIIIIVLIVELIFISCAIYGENRIIETSGMELDYIIVEVTGYCPCELCCGIWADGLTFTEDEAKRGCVAIDPKAGVFEMGMILYIEGYGYGVCNDIGGAIKGNRLDLCFDTHQEALDWGRKFVKVYIIGYKK